MALLECSFFSESIGMNTNVHVIVPQPTLRQIGLSGRGSPEGCPVLYLLHGLSDDHSTCLRRTNIERYAAEAGIAVVMPDGHRSFYTDQRNTLRYWQYISEELPQIIGGFFKFSKERKDTFAAGLSMGGYGALKLALNHPDRFSAAGCFSSVIRPWDFAKYASDRATEIKMIFGDAQEYGPETENDPLHMASLQAERKTPLPRLFLACGTEDFLYQENLLFKARLESLGIPFEFREEPGTHEWGFWDHQIHAFLNWLKEKIHFSSDTAEAGKESRNMSALNQLAGKMIADKIRSEAVKAVENHIQSAVINSLLPQSAVHGNAHAIPLRVKASLEMNLSDTLVSYTEHLGKDSSKTLSLPGIRKDLNLHTIFAVGRPDAMAQSREIKAENLSMTLSGTLSGIAFQQKIMGCGATINEVSFRVSVSGNASAEWLDAPPDIPPVGSGSAAG